MTSRKPEEFILKYMDMSRYSVHPLYLVVLLFASAGTVFAEGNRLGDSATRLIDMMNASLILICCVFIFAIVGTLRNKKLLSIIRSAHFLNIDRVITAWTLIGSAVVLYALVDILYAFRIVEDVKAYKIFKTIFGILFATGLFIQYKVLNKYLKKMNFHKTNSNRVGSDKGK